MTISRMIAVQLLILLSLTGCEAFSPSRPRSTAAAPADVTAQEYRLGTGDIVSVRVYGGDEDLRLERVRLDADGTLILPFGDYKAHGRTTREVETAITESIRGRLLRNPRVSVTIDEYRPFFVDGAVGRPGAYPYQPGLNVRRAITIAGGLRERASLQKIFVLRENDRTNTPVNVDLNTPVGPGDTIDVAESLF
jgi:polysaccharide export outer membrane protein